MANDGGELSVIELCPIHAIPTTKKKGEHRCWWDTPEMLDLLPWLRMVRKIHRYIVVTVGDDGSIVRNS